MINYTFEKLYQNQKLPDTKYRDTHELFAWDDHVPNPDDDVLEDLLQASSYRPRQDRQLQDGGEENPRQNSFTNDLRQSDKTQGRQFSQM